MNSEVVQSLFDNNPEYTELAFEGKCHDCNCDVTVVIERNGNNGGLFEVSGGALYNPNNTVEPSEMYLKCDKCFLSNRTLQNYQENEVYSRIVGYLRPIKQWNEAKRGEFDKRRMFDLDDIDHESFEKVASQTI